METAENAPHHRLHAHVHWANGHVEKVRCTAKLHTERLPKQHHQLYQFGLPRHGLACSEHDHRNSEGWNPGFAHPPYLGQQKVPWIVHPSDPPKLELLALACAMAKQAFGQPCRHVSALEISHGRVHANAKAQLGH